ncbi:MAG: TlpA disulfide reductase family protein, partial [Bacteroidota bacterium]|nr:TlpA disulfide reductase family protein [Bacteroidota bacterium]
WNLPVYGKNITKKLSDFKGKYMLLEFTATNCAACGKALEVMKRLESKFINNNQVAVVSVYSSKADDKNSLKTFVIKNKIKNDLLYADYINDLKTASELESNYKLWGYPTFYLIDKNGMVFKHLTGVSNVSEETEKKIIQLLDEKLKSN